MINVTRSSMPPFEEYCDEIRELWDSHWLTNMGCKHRELEAELNKDLGGADSLTLDFGKLDYISSAGLRVLLTAHKAMAAKGGMKICNVNEVVQEVFEVTGFADILTIE